MAALDQRAAGIPDGLAEVGNPQVFPQEERCRCIVAEFAGCDLQVLLRKQTGNVIADGDEHFICRRLKIVKFKGARAAILILLDKDNVHKADDAPIRQVQKLGNDLAG